ncbi:MAG: tRNA lysidine(34) synthetase TilS, partial [Betaproteobacteria bacterium]|nr:tRNA lysidine(34) synthetase TilS [Betaproteobacteria bacterium]
SARALCERFSVDLRVCALTPPASFVDGLEAWARQARYEAIEHVAADLALQRVLLAHHADDQAETFFINLIRGTGIAGLRGMPTVIERGNVVYIRPMLKVDRNILLEQAKDWGLAWDEDPSNGDETFLRNRIRSNLMPLLESIRPGTKQRIVDLMEDLSESTPQTIANVAYLDLGPIQSHSAIEQRDALYRWVKQVALRAPSRARLNVLHEFCFVSKLGRGHLKHGDFVFRRIGNRLLAEPRFLE